MKKWMKLLVLILAVSAVVAISYQPVIVQATQKYLSVTLTARSMPSDAELQNGLWYEDVDNPIYIGGYRVSFMKIYSLGGTTRVMDLSTYPRAYKDTDPHVYQIDTPFVVTEDDCNSFYNGETEEYPRPEIPDGTFIYRDTLNHCFLVGETAVHFAGEPLPGSFPVWIESETLPTPSWVDNKNSVFPMVFAAVKGQLVTTTIHEAQYKDVTAQNPIWQNLPPEMLTALRDYFTTATTEIRTTKIIKNKDRLILRILYDRAISPNVK